MELRLQRNADFIDRVTRLINRGPGAVPPSLEAVVRDAISSGAPRFYLTREYAWKQLRLRRNGSLRPRPERPYITAMWAELARALADRVASHPAEEEWVALDHVLACHATSRFFISEAEAMRLVRGARLAWRPRLPEPPQESPARLRLPRKRRCHPQRRHPLSVADSLHDKI